jgi:hypothetical protein
MLLPCARGDAAEAVRPNAARVLISRSACISWPWQRNTFLPHLLSITFERKGCGGRESSRIISYLSLGRWLCRDPYNALLFHFLRIGYIRVIKEGDEEVMLSIVLMSRGIFLRPQIRPCVIKAQRRQTSSGRQSTRKRW